MPEDAFDKLEKVAASQPISTPTAVPKWKTVLKSGAAWFLARPVAMLGVALATLAVIGVFVAFVLFGNHKASAEVLPTIAPTNTPAPTPTLTSTPVPTPTPTPIPALVVWSPSGLCAYVRPAPSPNNEPQACVPNSTKVIDTGERKQSGGFTWAKVQYPKNGYMAIGWMALNVVVWPVSPNSKTGAKWASLYDANKAVVQEALSPHTPVVILDDEGNGWLWVQLPDNTKGYLKAKDLEK